MIFRECDSNHCDYDERGRWQHHASCPVQQERRERPVNEHRPPVDYWY